MNPALCVSELYRYTPPVLYVCLPEPSYPHLSIPVITPGPPCSSTPKEKSESYIFYKLSAVKEGAKSKP